MTDDATEWVTVKIPEEVRDAAREDERTYGEVMEAGLDAEGTHGTEVYQVGDDDPAMQFDEVLDASKADIPDAEEIAREVARHFDYAEVATKTADEVEGRLR